MPSAAQAQGRPRQVLVVGSTGQDGSLLAERLAARGDAVTGISRSGIVLGEPRGAFDIRDAAQVRELLARLQPEEIYFLAVRHHSSEDPIAQDGRLFHESFAVNAFALIGFLDAIRTASPRSRLFYAGSSHIFGSAGSAVRDESSPINPDTIYGISKTAGLHACRFYRHTYGVFAAVGIMFLHESPFRREGFVAKKIARGAALAKAGSAERIKLGDLDATGDWGHAPDFVDAMQRILAIDAADDFVIATGMCHTVRDFAQAAYAAVGLDYRDHVESAPGLLRRRTGGYAGSPAKLMQRTGWRPSISFEEMVRKLVEAEVVSASVALRDSL
jgi:GDPmannose 4,6-dehydratase